MGDWRRERTDRGQKEEKGGRERWGRGDTKESRPMFTFCRQGTSKRSPGK